MLTFIRALRVMSECRFRESKASPFIRALTVMLQKRRAYILNMPVQSVGIIPGKDAL